MGSFSGGRPRNRLSLVRRVQRFALFFPLHQWNPLTENLGLKIAGRIDASPRDSWRPLRLSRVDLSYGACCYLPRQRDGTDRYYGVGYSTGPHIDMFEMSFVPTYPVRLARQVVKFEAGPGARLVYDLKKASCEQIEYRSTLLSQAVGGAMSAELSRNATGYAPEGHVGDIIFQALPIGAKYPC